MIHLTRSLVRKWLESLLHIHDSPRRTAFAYALGVFWGFSPFLGLHTLLGLACAFVFNLNRVAVVLGAYTNLPWILVPYYTLTTMAAAKVLGVRMPPDFSSQLSGLLELSVFGHPFWAEVGRLLAPLVWPFTLGSLVGASVMSVVAYLASRPFIEAGRRHLHLHHPSPPPPGDAP
jgi:uncharacterized protein